MRLADAFLAMLLAFGSVGPAIAGDQAVNSEASHWRFDVAGQHCGDDCCTDCPEFEHCKIVCSAALVGGSTTEDLTPVIQLHCATATRSIYAHNNRPQPPPPRYGF